MALSGASAVYGIFGWPVAHSASPGMQNAAFEAAGIDAVYVPFAVPPERLPQAVEGVRALGVRGLNVTLPHKETIVPLLDAVDPDARALGAVNTVSRDGDRLVGTNTDGPGLVRSLEEAGVSVGGRSVTVVGAGGAARAAVVGLVRAGAVDVTVAARRPERGESLLSDLKEVLRDVPSRTCRLDATLAERFERTDLLVQATHATLDGGPAADHFAASLPLDALPESAAVVDLVYEPRETSVLRAARMRGLTPVDGLGMLLHQGALAFETWTGTPAPLEAMRARLEAPEG
ncbi:MAG: shikimate dehydrogenase [Myxococcota bacterium]